MSPRRPSVYASCGWLLGVFGAAGSHRVVSRPRLPIYPVGLNHHRPKVATNENRTEGPKKRKQLKVWLLFLADFKSAALGSATLTLTDALSLGHLASDAGSGQHGHGPASSCHVICSELAGTRQKCVLCMTMDTGLPIPTHICQPSWHH